MSVARRLDRLQRHSAAKRTHTSFAHVEHALAEGELQAAKGVTAHPDDDFIIVQSPIPPRAGEPPVVHLAAT